MNKIRKIAKDVFAVCLSFVVSFGVVACNKKTETLTLGEDKTSYNGTHDFTAVDTAEK